MPKPPISLNTYRYNKGDPYFCMSSCFSLKLTDADGQTTIPTIKFADHPHFSNKDNKACTNLTIDGEETTIFLDSLDLEWYEDENNLWQVNYAPLALTQEENHDEEKKNEAIDDEYLSEPEEELSEDDITNNNDEEKEEPTPVLYQYNQEKENFFSCNASSITVPVISTDENKTTSFAVILLRNNSNFRYDEDDKKVYVTVKVNGKEQDIEVNSPELRWVPQDPGKTHWSVSYGEPQKVLEVKDTKDEEEEDPNLLDNEDELIQHEEQEEKALFYTITEREKCKFEFNILELQGSSSLNNKKESIIFSLKDRTNEFEVVGKQVYAKVTVGNEPRPRQIPIDSPQLQWQYEEKDGQKIWSCSPLSEYRTYYLPTKVENTVDGMTLTLLLCNDYGEIDKNYTNKDLRFKKNSITISENDMLHIGEDIFPLETFLFETTDNKNFIPINSGLVKNNDHTKNLRSQFKNSVVTYLNEQEEQKHQAAEKKKNTRPLTHWEQAQQQDGFYLKILVFLQPLLIFILSSYRFWNYLRTPYFMPSLALKHVDKIHSKWFPEKNFIFSITAEDKDDDAIEYNSLEDYKTHYHQQTQTKLLGRYALPYFLGHGLWLLLSFIPLPFIKAHEQRVALARDIKHMQHALTKKLENADDKITYLAFTGEKQQLNPWRFSANAAMKYQITNGLYRLAMYSGALLFTTIAILALVTLAAPTPLLPITMIGAGFLFIASAAAALLCFQEVFNPGSLLIAIRKALKPTIALQDVQSIKTLLLTSPLLFPFYASYKEIPGTEPGKRAITEQGNHGNKNPLLDAYAHFIPTGNLQDTTLLRTLFNPFQLMQMTLTWVTLATFLITDAAAKLFQAIPLINKVVNALNTVFKTILYGFYSGAFLLLNLPKQALSYLTHAIDSPITITYRGIDTLNSAYSGNAYVLAQHEENDEPLHIILTHTKPEDEELPLFKDHPSKPTNKAYLRIRIKQAFNEAPSKFEDFFAKLVGPHSP